MINFFTKGSIGKLCFGLFNKTNTILNIDKLKNNVKRVYTFDDLGYRSSGGHWHVIDVDTAYDYGKCESETSQTYDELDKLYHHMKSAWNYRVFCNQYGVSFTCVTDKFGQIYGHYQYGYRFFEFGVKRSLIRYDICYAIANEVHPEFTQWLKETFGPIENQYHNDLNL